MDQSDTSTAAPLLRGDIAGGMPLLTVTGTHYAMGLSLGHRLRPHLEVLVQDCFALLRRLGSPDAGGGADGPAALQRDFSALEAAMQPALGLIRTADPQQFRELEGIAEASGIAAERLLFVHAFFDLLALGGATTPVSVAGSALLTQEQTEGSSPWLGFAWYLPARLAAAVTLIRRIPDNGPSSLSLGLAGLSPVLGISEAGLAIASHDLRARDGAYQGLPGSALLSAMLSSPTMDDAVHRTRRAPRMGGRAFAILEASGRRAAIETSGLNQAVLPDPQRSAPRVHSDHALDLGIAGSCAGIVDPASMERLAWLARLARGADQVSRYEVAGWFALPKAAMPQVRDADQLSCAAVVVAAPKDRSLYLHQGTPPAELSSVQL